MALLPACLLLISTLAVGDGEVVATETGLRYVDLEIGVGPRVRHGDSVRVHYVGWLEDGTAFDSSRRRGRTLKFKVGRHQVIKGWEEGVVGMQIGGRRKLIVPPELAYGKRGRGQIIPPDATLTFEIELVGFD